MIVASAYPFQSLSAFLSMFYLMLLIPIVFSILYGIGLGLPLLGTVFLASGFKEIPSKVRLLLGSLAAPFILFLGTFLFFSVLQYAGYSTHMLKARDLIRATNGPAEYFFKYVAEFGTPLQFPKFVYDIGLENLTYKERLRAHVATIYMGDDEIYYYVTNEYPKYTKARVKYEELKETGQSPGRWPELTEEESLDLDFIRKTMMEEPLDDDDLKRLSEINKNYEKRVGRSISGEEVLLATQFIKLIVEYRGELASCLLKSLETKKPFISEKLKKLNSEMRHLGMDSKAELDSDFRAIRAAGTGEIWTDENGQKRYPATREDILKEIKKNEMVNDNIKKFYNTLKK